MARCWVVVVLAAIAAKTSGGGSIDIGIGGLLFAPFGDSGAWLRAGPSEPPTCFVTEQSTNRVYFGRVGPEGLIGQTQLLLVDGNRIASWGIEDLDGDGDDDLIVVGDNPDQISLVFQRDGRFDMDVVVDVPGMGSNAQVSTGDFNADGLVDLCIGDSARIRVFLASSSWTFLPENEVAINTNTSGAWVGALDDSPGDEIVARIGGGLKVFRLEGDAVIELDQYALGFTPFRVVVGDFRGSGEIEILATEFRSGGGFFHVLDLVGGELSETAEWFLEGLDSGVQSFEDIDADGFRDLLVHGDGGATSVCYGVPAAPDELPFDSEIFVLGGYTSAPRMQGRAQAIDVNGDGELDFVTHYHRSGFRVVQGDGDRFGTRVLYSGDAGIAPRALVAYPPDDLRATGVLAVTESRDRALTVYLADSGEDERLRIVEDDRIQLGEDPITRFGDINGDTVSDYAGIGDSGSGSPSRYIFWALGDPGGDYGVEITRSIGFGGGSGFNIVDWDRDSYNDVVFASGPYFSFFRGTPSGILMPETQIPTPLMNGVSAFVDLDGDGSVDHVRFEARERIKIWYNHGDGTVGQVAELLMPAITSSPLDRELLCVDINGDRRLDILVPTTTGFGVVPSTGPRSYGPLDEVELEASFLEGGSFGIRASDLNDDGYTEVIMFAGGGFAILGFDIARNFVVQQYSLGSAGLPLIHDMDRDGLDDIAFVDGGGAVGVYFNNSEPRCLADHAPDGVANFLDLGLFLSDLIEGKSFADLNRDGRINFVDLGEFLSALGEECSK